MTNIPDPQNDETITLTGYEYWAIHYAIIKREQKRIIDKIPDIFLDWKDAVIAPSTSTSRSVALKQIQRDIITLVDGQR